MPISFWSGGGVICRDSSPTITRNHIVDNVIGGTWMIGMGGGIYCDGWAHPEISFNVIRGNAAEYEQLGGRGGGISCEDGASPRIERNLISGNRAGHGGGIYCLGSGTCRVVGNVISGNRAIMTGAGIYVIFDYCEITSNIVTGNVAETGFGGGIAVKSAVVPLLYNTFAGNSAVLGGGGIRIEQACSVWVTGTILWRNAAPVGAQLDLGVLSSLNSVCTIDYCDVEGGLSAVEIAPGNHVNWGSGMIDADPMFVDRPNGDLHIRWDSPCRDSGNPGSTAAYPDFEGDLRIAHGTIDMGADEFYQHLYHAGDVVPGAPIAIKVVGAPGAAVRLALGNAIQDPPRVTPYGELWLAMPLVGSWQLGTIPGTGVLIRPVTVPSGWLPGSRHPGQALVGAFGGPATRLTNLLLLEVE